MEKVKYGLLGTATIAERSTIEGMNSIDNSEFYAVAGRNPSKVDTFVQKYGFKKGYYSYEELLQDKDVEAIYIALPNGLHHEWAIKAMRAGKHVLCEKPMGCTTKEVEEMIAVSKECGVLLMEAFAYLHSPLIKELKELVKNKKYGELKVINSAFMTLVHDKSNVRMQRELLGGAMYDLGCYPTSLMLELFNLEMPTEVKAIAHFVDKIDDVCMAYMCYEDGRKVTITSGMCSTKRICYYHLYFEKAEIKIDQMYNVKGDVEFTIETLEDGKVTKVVRNIPDNYGLEIEQFANCIRNGEAPYVSNEFSIKNAKILDMVLNSCGYNAQ